MTEDVKERVAQLGITISPLVESDIEALDPILRQHVRDRDTGKIVEKEIANIKRCMRGLPGEDEDRIRKYLVAKTADGRVVGCMAYSSPDGDMVRHFRDIDSTQAAELLNAFVDSGLFRGGGIGKKLFDAVCDVVKAEDKKYLLINSGPRYRGSWGFYDRVCSENRGFITEKYGKDGDANTWIKFL